MVGGKHFFMGRTIVGMEGQPSDNFGILAQNLTNLLKILSEMHLRKIFKKNKRSRKLCVKKAFF